MLVLLSHLKLQLQHPLGVLKRTACRGKGNAGDETGQAGAQTPHQGLQPGLTAVGTASPAGMAPLGSAKALILTARPVRPPVRKLLQMTGVRWEGAPSPSLVRAAHFRVCSKGLPTCFPL